MSFDVEALAPIMNRKTGHETATWIKALESARLTIKEQEIDFQSLEHIALATRTPESFTVIVRLIYQHLRSNRNEGEISGMVLEHASRSLFSLSDWVDSIAFFYGWLIDRDRKTDFPTMLNYLECCASSPDAREAGQTLLVLTEDMLEVHGYEGRQDAKCK